MNFLFQVRWADINERQNQQRMRDVGFVVGQTDWSRMMDDSHATQALNRTKFIWKTNWNAEIFTQLWNDSIILSRALFVCAYPLLIKHVI